MHSIPLPPTKPGTCAFSGQTSASTTEAASSQSSPTFAQRQVTEAQPFLTRMRQGPSFSEELAPPLDENRLRQSLAHRSWKGLSVPQALARAELALMDVLASDLVFPLIVDNWWTSTTRLEPMEFTRPLFEGASQSVVTTPEQLVRFYLRPVMTIADRHFFPYFAHKERQDLLEELGSRLEKRLCSKVHETCRDHILLSLQFPDMVQLPVAASLRASLQDRS